MSFSKNEVVLLPIPFTDLTSRKVRPAVVLGHSSHAGDLFVVPISSQLRNVDIVLQGWQGAGLNVRCGIKSQIATIEDRLVIHSLARSLWLTVPCWRHDCEFGCSFEHG